MKRWISFVLMLTMLLSLPADAFAKTPFYEDSKAIARAAESVLMLTCYDKEGNAVSTGSGFLAFEDGIIITNYHVIEGITGAIKANTEDGMYFDINEILCTDPAADVALLKTKARTRLDLLTLGSSSSLGKGSRVVAIGSPLGLLNTVSEGIYSGIIFDETDYILFTAAISSGSSGGALFNEDGEVVGVTAASYTEGQNLNLAVPIENVEKLWNLYQSGEYVEASIDNQTAENSSEDVSEALITAEHYFEEGKYSEAVEWYSHAAERGNAEAQYKLGSCYYLGLGTELDISKAEKWISKSISQGYAEAECLLGFLYHGQGKIPSPFEKPDWFQAAIDIAYPESDIRDEYGNIIGKQTNIWSWYQGYNIEKDDSKAAEWFLNAAEQNYAIAQYNIGTCYKNGYGVAQNYSEALNWYLKAAENGYGNASFEVGYYYAIGREVQEDTDKALEWFEKAAVQQGYGQEKVRDYIGQCLYSVGLYFDVNNNWNYQKAVKWYSLGAQYGNASAQRELARINGW